MAEYDIIIRGGTIVDGTGMPRYVSDLAIKDGKVAKIGGLRGSGATQLLDASGLIVAPGQWTYTPTTMRRCSGTRTVQCLGGTE